MKLPSYRDWIASHDWCISIWRIIHCECHSILQAMLLPSVVKTRKLIERVLPDPCVRKLISRGKDTIANVHVTLDCIRKISPIFRQIYTECGEQIWRDTHVPVWIVFIKGQQQDIITRYPCVNWNVVGPVIVQDTPHAIALDPHCFNAGNAFFNLCFIFRSTGDSYFFHELIHFINTYPRGNQGSPTLNLAHFILNEYEAEYLGVQWGLCYALENKSIPFGCFMPGRHPPPGIRSMRGMYNQTVCFLAQRRLANEGGFTEARATLEHPALPSLRSEQFEHDWTQYLEIYDALLPGVSEQLLRLESALGVWGIGSPSNAIRDNLVQITSCIDEIFSTELAHRHSSLDKFNSEFQAKFGSHR